MVGTKACCEGEGLLSEMDLSKELRQKNLLPINWLISLNIQHKLDAGGIKFNADLIVNSFISQPVQVKLSSRDTCKYE